MTRRVSVEERLTTFVDRSDADGCWPWIGHVNRFGYSQMKINGKTRIGHRMAYEHFVGPIPPGLTVDHTCHNEDDSCQGGPSCLHRRCVNPAHLEAVTADVNKRRGLAAKRAAERMRAKTHCPQGHPYDEANTMLRGPAGWRLCRTCSRERARAWEKKRAKRTRVRTRA